MKNFAAFVVLGTLLASCSTFNLTPPDPQVAAPVAGELACLIVSTEAPKKVPAVIEGTEVALAIVNSPSPSVMALHEALAKITDPKAKLYVTAAVSAVVVAYPQLANADATIPPEAIEALKSALTTCHDTLVAGRTTTSTSSSTSTTTSTTIP